MLRSKIITCVAALVFSGAATLAHGDPQRVVSLNVCTDQLAHLLAQPDQVVSVSKLAIDPRLSAYADAFQDMHINDGTAEGVMLLAPDLVLAGTYTTRATVEMLGRLGVTVEQFAPINSLNDVRANITRMGDLLGTPDRAAAVIAAFDKELDAFQTPVSGPAPRAALYYALGSTAGAQTLPGELMALAGIDNIAAELGLPFGGRLPLEELILSEPDMVLVGRPYGGHARATELLEHPVLKRLDVLKTIPNGQDWVCETPRLISAIKELRRIRTDWEEAR